MLAGLHPCSKLLLRPSAQAQGYSGTPPSPPADWPPAVVCGRDLLGAIALQQANAVWIGSAAVRPKRNPSRPARPGIAI
jgi:hypothetical protein